MNKEYVLVGDEKNLSAVSLDYIERNTKFLEENGWTAEEGRWLKEDKNCLITEAVDIQYGRIFKEKYREIELQIVSKSKLNGKTTYQRWGFYQQKENKRLYSYLDCRAIEESSEEEALESTSKRAKKLTKLMEGIDCPDPLIVFKEFIDVPKTEENPIGGENVYTLLESLPEGAELKY